MTEKQSDQDSLQQEKEPDLTTSEVIAFLDERTPSSACPACLKDDWGVEYVRLTSEPDRIFGSFFIPVALPFEFVGDNSGQTVKTMPNLSGRAALLVICSNCGFIRTHDYKVIWGWATEKRKQQKAADEQAPENHHE